MIIQIILDIQSVNLLPYPLKFIYILLIIDFLERKMRLILLILKGNK